MPDLRFHGSLRDRCIRPSAVHILHSLRDIPGAYRMEDREGGIRMREIKVTYTLSDEEESHLKRIAEAYRKEIPGFREITEDRVFELLMTTGSASDIKKKFEFCKLFFGRQDGKGISDAC